MMTKCFLDKLEIQFTCEEYNRKSDVGGVLTETGKVHFRPKLTFKTGSEQYGKYWATVTDMDNTQENYIDFYLKKPLDLFLDNYNLKQFIINLV